MTEAAMCELSSIGAEIDNLSGGEKATIEVASGDIFKTIRLLETHDLRLVSVTPQQETLEDAFVRLAA
jgi:hypothetical protein